MLDEALNITDLAGDLVYFNLGKEIIPISFTLS